MTFGRALGVVAGLCGAIAILSAAQEFWDLKEPATWSADEVQTMLGASPWAKAANISFFNNGPGGYGAGIGGANGAGLGSRRATGNQRVTGRGTGQPAPDSSNSPVFSATVRWGSSRAIRAALKTPMEDDATSYYIVELVGNVPTFAAPDDDNPTANAQRVQMLRESTKLERKSGDPIYLDRVETVAAGTRFYFTRRDPIVPGNKEVTFTTKLGPLVIKAKFTLKDMQYKGKLDL